MSAQMIDANRMTRSDYMADAYEMTYNEMVLALEKIAAAWRGQPHLFYEYSERVRCSDLTKAIRERFGQTYYIFATKDSPGSYRVLCKSQMS